MYLLIAAALITWIIAALRPADPIPPTTDEERRNWY
jgi:hypothetical protein